MAFCGKCGTKIEEGIKFCSNCGEAIGAPAPEQEAQQAPPVAEQPTANQNDFSAKVAALNNTGDTTADYDANDISQNKAMGILAYFGPLCFIPMFAAKGSKFARFHANQGLVLLIADVAYGVLQIILMAILRSVFPWNWSYGYLGGRGFVFDTLSTILSLVWIVFGILSVLGIINAVNGRAKELPVIGKFKFLK